MIYQWLKKNSSSTSVVVVFSGWGFDQRVIEHMVNNRDGFDVLFVQDYRELDAELPDLEKYGHRYLIAWSFGVAAYSAWSQCSSPKKQLASVQFDQMIAINGTMHPVDRFLGIPNAIMLKTIKTLSQKSFEVFVRRSFVDNALPNLNINVSERRQELEAILVRKHSVIEGWDRVWISNQDKIFPTKNLLNAWQAYNEKQNQFHKKTAELKYCEAPHSPFHLWSSWNEIISS